MLRLSQLLHAQPEPIDPSCGQSGPFKIAIIDEAHCIGCTLCIVACPVDAIVGANKRMHTVIADACTGCELCLPPCPVDCIEMVTAPHNLDWTPTRAELARNRFMMRNARLDRHTSATATPTVSNALSKESILEDVMARVKARRARQADPPQP
jgi:electron transport complex protein RnfB